MSLLERKMIMQSETIASIATAMNNSGIGIIRVSGPDAIAIVDKIYKTKYKEQKLCSFDTNTIHYGFIYDGDELLDEVMVAIMKAPHSYTTEDTVEIDCHGGNLIMKKILEVVLKNGARLAEPGEFTKRAFLNGRIDLSEAEAVMDMIDSSSDFSLKASVKQLRGSISSKIKELRDSILYEIAFIESALDDPEHISLDGYPEKLLGKSEGILADLEKLIKSSDNGKLIKEGINTVIIGKPNAGKSSFLNVLIGEEKAIVTSVAGTTRDILEESIQLSGIGLKLMDTAGIHDTDDEVESIGVKKAIKASKEADLILYVVDTSRPLDESDYEILEMIQDKPMILVCNKMDLDQVVSDEDLSRVCRQFGFHHVEMVKISAKENLGIDVLEEKVEKMFFGGNITMNDEVVITNTRHKEALVESFEAMKQVHQSILDDMPEDFYSIDLLIAYSSLGRIIGEAVDDDVVNEIFAKFCMGK